MRLVRVLSLVAAVETFLLMVMGTVVRVTGASKSIPDWPLAFGTLVPHMTPLVFLEWSHRLLVLLVVVTLVALVARAASLPGRLWMYCLATLLLVVATAVLGGLAVLPWRLAGDRGARSGVCHALFRQPRRPYGMDTDGGNQVKGTGAYTG